MKHGESASARRAVALERRLRTIPAVVLAAIALTLTLVPLLLVLAGVDVLRGRARLPLARLAAFGWCWTCLETVGVLVAAGLWLVGRRRDVDVHYAVQRWWADRLLRSLRATCGLELDIEGAETLGDGPTVLLVRHASLADSLVTAWAVTERARLRPRFVLKKELLADPCLDVVGNRVPNCFLDRGAEDSGPGLAAVRALGESTGPGDVSIIFPEGTRSNDVKRRRALDRISARDPGRAQRLAQLNALLPPRPSGTRELLLGAGVDDVVLGWHVGFEGLDTFGGIVKALGRRVPPIRMRFERVSIRSLDLDDSTAFEAWLDDAWLKVDASVTELLAQR